MAIQINPAAQARIELTALLKEYPAAITLAAVAVLEKALAGERLLMEAHPDCGADNPDGKPALCKCYCHKGHYRHVWVPVIKTPVLNPDGTYHLLDRCKYCPDMRLKIIKAAWVAEKHTLVSLEYLIRGEQRVLTKEEWLERCPKPGDMEFIRKVNP